MKLRWEIFGKRAFSSFVSSAESFKAMNSKGIIAVCQMTATDNKAENLETCTNLISSAKERNAQVGLTEYFH